MSVKNTVKVTLKKEAVVDQFPDMLIFHDYLETDTFEDGLEYGPDTIKKEPPLDKWLYTFSKGARIMYMGDNEWKLEADINKKEAIVEALRKINPVKSRNFL